jgi:hypothetical protein
MAAEPHHVPLPQQPACVQCCCGSTFTVLLVTGGKVVIFGKADVFQSVSRQRERDRRARAPSALIWGHFAALEPVWQFEGGLRLVHVVRRALTDDSIKVLVAETMAGKDNERLDLSGETLNEEEVRKLSLKAGELSHVKEASFSDCNMNRYSWERRLLTAFVQELTHLQFLDLSGNILVNTDDEQQLALVSPELKQLKTLNISRASISATELDEISYALGEHKGLTSLDVSVNPFFLVDRLTQHQLKNNAVRCVWRASAQAASRRGRSIVLVASTNVSWQRKMPRLSQ